MQRQEMMEKKVEKMIEKKVEKKVELMEKKVEMMDKKVEKKVRVTPHKPQGDFDHQSISLIWTSHIPIFMTKTFKNINELTNKC